ncbi:hypothetical protein [Bacillus sp. 179-C3.3 HS]|uniref:hypothetical protein n=1 Tax=Bacillus sp. 179-C3.3 HS TaxID=3232162 RepID=UPI00399FCD44
MAYSCDFQNDGGVYKLILHNGITGFYDSEDNAPTQVDGKLFKQLCFDFACRRRGEIIDFTPPQSPSNIAQFDGHHRFR